jgi:hypothetical protein
MVNCGYVEPKNRRLMGKSERTTRSARNPKYVNIRHITMGHCGFATHHSVLSHISDIPIKCLFILPPVILVYISMIILIHIPS